MRNRIWAKQRLSVFFFTSCYKLQLLAESIPQINDEKKPQTEKSHRLKKPQTEKKQTAMHGYYKYITNK